MDAPIKERRSDWWLLALRGAAAILFGVAAFVWPGLTIEVLVLLFALYVLIDGVVAIFISLRRGVESSPSLLVQGIVGVIAGLVALIFPSLAALALVLIIAAWAILTGIAEIALTFRIRE